METELKIPTDYGYKVVTLAPDAKKIYLEVTTLCNFACTTCIRNSWDEGLGQMEWTVFEKILQQLKDLPDLEKVHFGGFGEPLSHSRIFEMIKAIKDQGLQAEMITNGSLLTQEAAARLLELGLDSLYVSLDSPEEEDFNQIRQGADFSGVIANLRAFHQMRKARQSREPNLGIEFVAMRKNYHQLPQLASLAEDLQARLIVTNLLPYIPDMQDQIVYDLDDTVLPFGKESLLLMVRAQLPQMKLRTQRYCKFIEDKAMAVTWEGKVSPCYAFMHSYHCYIYRRKKKMYPFHLGNVAEETLREIWTKPRYALFRATVKDFQFPSCTDCKFLEGCSYTDDNEMDCWGNSPSCADCLWSRGLIVCP